MKNLFSLLVLVLLLCQCKDSVPSIPIEINPPAEGFNLDESDAKAVELADKVMEALGGRDAWNNTEYIKWNFFNSRRHIWNKKTNDLVIESLRDSSLYKLNLDNMEGEVNYRGITLTKADSLDKYLEKGKSMWINDAYWLIMPYKLKDSGVTLKYLNQDTTAVGVLSDKIELTFAEVGVTPDNKYHVYIDPSTNLVTQWDFFGNFQDTIPRFAIPWENYSKYGDIMLSGDRGGNRKLTEIEVGPQLASYFE